MTAPELSSFVIQGELSPDIQRRIEAIGCLDDEWMVVNRRACADLLRRAAEAYRAAGFCAIANKLRRRAERK